jgi:hypothetical protein
MRGKVTADAYSGGRRGLGGDASPRHYSPRELNKLVGGGFVELHCWARIILFVAAESPLGAIVTRDVSHPSGGRAWGLCMACG